MRCGNILSDKANYLAFTTRFHKSPSQRSSQAIPGLPGVHDTVPNRAGVLVPVCIVPERVHVPLSHLKGNIRTLVGTMYPNALTLAGLVYPHEPW